MVHCLDREGMYPHSPGIPRLHWAVRWALQAVAGLVVAVQKWYPFKKGSEKHEDEI